MKKKTLLITSFAAMSGLVLTSYQSGPINGGAGNHTGSGTSTASCSGGGCHDANNTNTAVVIFLSEAATPTTPISAYTPGHTYLVHVAATNSSAALSKFGFQLSAVKSTNTNMQEGTFATGGTSGIAVRTSGGLSIVEHTAPRAAAATGIYNVSFNWTAPVAATGKVKFFGMVNVVNGDGGTSGDQPNGTSIELDEASTGIGSLQQTIALNAYPSPASNVLQVQVKGAKNGAYKLSVYDMNGRAILQHGLVVSAAAQDATIDISTLSAGVYQLHVTNGGASGIVSFVKN